jgi:hypothetical protein
LEDFPSEFRNSFNLVSFCKSLEVTGEENLFSAMSTFPFRLAKAWLEKEELDNYQALMDFSEHFEQGSPGLKISIAQKGLLRQALANLNGNVDIASFSQSETHLTWCPSASP